MFIMNISLFLVLFYIFVHSVWQSKLAISQLFTARFRDVKQVLTPGEWINKFHCGDQDGCDRGHNFMLI